MYPMNWLMMSLLLITNITMNLMMMNSLLKPLINKNNLKNNTSNFNWIC